MSFVVLWLLAVVSSDLSLRLFVVRCLVCGACRLWSLFVVVCCCLVLIVGGCLCVVACYCLVLLSGVYELLLFEVCCVRFVGVGCRCCRLLLLVKVVVC